MSEFSSEFVHYMKNRMEMSYAKYGPIKAAYPHKINALDSAEKRIRLYQETGNTEWLVDAANFLMIEFMLPSHVKAHFRATASHESPGRSTLDEGQTDKSNDNLSGEAWKEIEEYRKNTTKE